MNQQNEEKFATAILQHLFRGQWLSGITFGVELQIIFDSRPGLDGIPYINLSRWDIRLSTDTEWPLTEEELPELSKEEEFKILFSLREIDVIQIRLIPNLLHLIIDFENGQSLFIWGTNERYE